MARRTKTEVIDDPLFNLPGLIAEKSELLLRMFPRQPKKSLPD
jgi:hypothetical protein